MTNKSNKSIKSNKTNKPSSAALLIFAAVLATTSTVCGQDVGTWQQIQLTVGGTMDYMLVLPDDFDPEKTYPALLGIPPVRQDKAGAQEGLELYWGRQAQMRGWIVVSPAKVGDMSFFHGSEKYIPQLLDTVRLRYKIEGNKFHLAGTSAGGRAAFRIATSYPRFFHSLTAMPGYPVNAEDMERLPALRDISVYMFIGGEDHTAWLRKANLTHEKLQDMGIDSTVRVYPGEGHAMISMEGDGLMAHLDTVREHRVTLVAARSVESVLDKLHKAAARADGEKYFALFAPDAVFLGTAPGERWPLEAFKAYAMPYFDAGEGWTYESTARHVSVAPDGATAWFDEVLMNDKYGECRGSGVLTKGEDGWRIAQYNLSFVVPNDLAPIVVDMVRKHAGDARDAVTP